MRKKIVFILSLLIAISNVCSAQITLQKTIKQRTPNSSFGVARDSCSTTQEVSYLSQSSNLFAGYYVIDDTITGIYRGYVEFDLDSIHFYHTTTINNNSTLLYLYCSFLTGADSTTNKASVIGLKNYFLNTNNSISEDWDSLAKGTVFATVSSGPGPDGAQINEVSGSKVTNYIQNALKYEQSQKLLAKVGFSFKNNNEKKNGLEFNTNQKYLYLVVNYTINPPNRKPTGLRFTASSHGINLYWNDMQQKGYIIYNESGDSIGSTIKTSFPIEGLSPATYYKYNIRSYNEAGKSPLSDTLTALTTPLPPTNVKVTDSTSNTVSISWKASAGIVSGYLVKYRNGNSGPTNSATTSNTNIKITGLSSNTPYNFYIYAYNSSGNSDKDDTIYATTKTYPPPYNVSVADDPVDNDYVLHWQFNGGGATGFHIYEELPEHKLVGTVYGNAYMNSFPISKGTLTYSTAYIYAIFAFDSGGEGSGAGIGFKYTISVPYNLAVSNVTSSGCFLTWDESTGHATGFKVYIDGNYYTSTTSGSCSISGLSSGNKYALTVSSYDDQGDTTVQCSAHYVYTVPSAPSNLQATYNAADDSCTLSWIPSPNNPYGGYNIYCLFPSSSAGLFGTTTSNTFLLTSSSILPPYPYVFEVDAYVNDDGTSYESGFTNTMGVGFSSSPQNTSLKSSIINNTIGGLNLLLFPNPVLNKLYIKGVTGSINVSVMNLEGQIVKKKQLQLGIGSQTGFIDLSELNNGVYLVKIQYDNKVVINKIVKK